MFVKTTLGVFFFACLVFELTGVRAIVVKGASVFCVFVGFGVVSIIYVASVWF